jgi:TusA-related sulfurtransferase
LVVDCTGLACPLPVVKTAQAIKTLAQGQVLELIATPAAPATICSASTSGLTPSTS